MRYLLAVLIALVGVILGWLVAAFGTLILGSAFGLTDFEGQRGTMAFFAIGPLGGLTGFVLGLWLWLRR